MDEDGFAFRLSTEEDIPFLHSSWGSSYYAGNHAHKRISPTDFHSFHGQIRNRYLARETKRILMCCPMDDPWLILGWIATEALPTATVLQYLYVKSAFKGQGIAELLIKKSIPPGVIYFTHLTERASKIMCKKYDLFSDYKFLPHLV